MQNRQINLCAVKLIERKKQGSHLVNHLCDQVLKYTLNNVLIHLNFNNSPDADSMYHVLTSFGGINIGKTSCRFHMVPALSKLAICIQLKLARHDRWINCMAAALDAGED